MGRKEEKTVGILSGLIDAIAVQPPRNRPSFVPDTMEYAGRNEQFFSYGWSKDLPADFKLHVSFKDHDQFVDRVTVIFPHLARRIGPDVATEPAGVPEGSD